MARGAIPITIAVKEGVNQAAQTSSDATNKHYISPNDGRIILEMININAAPQTVTFKSSRVLQGLALKDLVVTLAATGSAGDKQYSGPWPVDLFNQTYNDGVTDHLDSILIDPSVSTDIKFRAIQVPAPTRSQ